MVHTAGRVAAAVVTSKGWRGFRSVLCAVDFSERSRLALRHAEIVARRAGARLTVLYVNDPLLIAAASAALHDRRLVERSRRELRAFVEATLGARTTPETSLGSGHPSNEILRIAARAGVDLLVLGTQGLTGADRVLLGSTTLGVLRRTDVPVLAVPYRREDAASAVARSWPGARIMAAVELDRAARLHIARGASVARFFGASVLCLHVVEALSAPAWLIPDRRAHDRIRVSEAQEQLDRLVTATETSVRVDTRVVCGRPADEIAAVAEAERIQLVVTALRDRRGWFSAPRGSVSYDLLSQAQKPVLACPPQWRPR